MVPQTRKITLIEGKEIAIKRASESDDSRAPAHDNLFLVNSHISKQHGAIRLTKGDFYIKDSCSTFGTVLNDCFLIPGKWKRLEDHDTLGFVVSRHSSSIQKILSRFDEKTTSSVPLREFGFPTVALEYKVEIDGNTLLLIPLNAPVPPSISKDNSGVSSSTPIILDGEETVEKGPSSDSGPLYDKTMDISTEVSEPHQPETTRIIPDIEENEGSLPTPSVPSSVKSEDADTAEAKFCSYSDGEITVLESEVDEEENEEEVQVFAFEDFSGVLRPDAIVVRNEDDLDDLDDLDEDVDDDNEDDDEKDKLSTYSGDQVVWTSEEDSCDCVEYEGECCDKAGVPSCHQSVEEQDSEGKEDDDDDDDDDDDEVETDSLVSNDNLGCICKDYFKERLELWPGSEIHCVSYSEDNCDTSRGCLQDVLDDSYNSLDDSDFELCNGRKRSFDAMESDEESCLEEEDGEEGVGQLIKLTRPKKKAKVEQPSRLKGLLKEVGKGLFYVTGTIVALGMYGHSKAKS